MNEKEKEERMEVNTIRQTFRVIRDIRVEDLSLDNGAKEFSKIWDILNLDDIVIPNTSEDFWTQGKKIVEDGMTMGENFNASLKGKAVNFLILDKP